MAEKQLLPDFVAMDYVQYRAMNVFRAFLHHKRVTKATETLKSSAQIGGLVVLCAAGTIAMIGKPMREHASDYLGGTKNTNRNPAPEFPEGQRTAGLDGVIEEPRDSMDLFNEHAGKVEENSGNLGGICVSAMGDNSFYDNINPSDPAS